MEYNKKQGTFNTVMKVVIAVLLVLVLIVSFLLFAMPAIKGKSKDMMIRKKLSTGNKYLSEMDYDKAIAAFSDVIIIDENNTAAYIGLGDAYSGKGQWRQAVESYDQAVDTIGVIIGITPGSSVYDPASSEVWDDFGINRDLILSDAGLPDTEYLSEDELILIAVLNDQATEDVYYGEPVIEIADYFEYNVQEIFDVFVNRNIAIAEDLKEIESVGGDTSIYSEYLAWISEGHLPDSSLGGSVDGAAGSADGSAGVGDGSAGSADGSAGSAGSDTGAAGSDAGTADGSAGSSDAAGSDTGDDKDSDAGDENKGDKDAGSQASSNELHLYDAYVQYLEKYEGDVEAASNRAPGEPQGPMEIHYFTCRDLNNDKIAELITYQIVNFRYEIIQIFTLAEDGSMELMKFEDGTDTVFDNNHQANGAYTFYICQEGHIHNHYGGGGVQEHKVYIPKDRELIQYLHYFQDSMVQKFICTKYNEDISYNEYESLTENCDFQEIDWTLNNTEGRNKWFGNSN